MGHYASEMKGGNFTDWERLPKIVGDKLLSLSNDNQKSSSHWKHTRKKMRKILEVKIEWINPYSYTKRIWIDVNYRCGKRTGPTDGGCCATYSIEEATKVLSKKENALITNLISKLER